MKMVACTYSFLSVFEYNSYVFRALIRTFITPRWSSSIINMAFANLSNLKYGTVIANHQSTIITEEASPAMPCRQILVTPGICRSSALVSGKDQITFGADQDKDPKIAKSIQISIDWNIWLRETNGTACVLRKPYIDVKYWGSFVEFRTGLTEKSACQTFTGSIN